MKRVGTVLGAMEFGRGPCTGAIPQNMVSAFINYREDFQHIDTALMYTNGDSETALGKMDSWKSGGTMATKINPWEGKNYKEKSLREQIGGCLKRLEVNCVELLYLHAPDHNTEIEETLRVLNDIHGEGKFKKLGLSNYSSWQVARCMELCRSKGWVAPSVYQGMYSALTRSVEEELFPCLRFYGIAFYAYSPLAGGMLTGKYQFDQEKEKSISTGRFNGLKMDNIYRQRYWKKEHFDQIEALKVLLAEVYPGEEVGVPEAAYRWIYNNSKLSGERGDCVIIGASRLEQLQMNMELSQKPPLDKAVVEFFNNWWTQTKQFCPKYFR